MTRVVNCSGVLPGHTPPWRPDSTPSLGMRFSDLSGVMAWYNLGQIFPESYLHPGYYQGIGLRNVMYFQGITCKQNAYFIKSICSLDMFMIKGGNRPFCSNLLNAKRD